LTSEEPGIAASTENDWQAPGFDFLCILIFRNNSYFTTTANGSGSFLIADLHPAVLDVLLSMP
jgi:hypothetical protein